MQQTDRIELIKAAVELTKITCEKSYSIVEIFDLFQSFYDYLQLKLEAVNNETIPSI